MVFEVNDLYCDHEGRKAVVGYFLMSDTLDGALLKAGLLSYRIQLHSRASLVSSRLLVDNDVEILRNFPAGTVRRRLVVLMEGQGLSNVASHVFKLYIYDPIPELLLPDGQAVDFSSPAWQDFYGSVLADLSDIHGHNFSRVVKTYVEQS